MTVPSEGASRARTRAVVVAAVVVAVVAAVLSGLEIGRLASGSGAGSRPSAAAAGATTALTDGGQLAVDFTSFDYQTLNHDFEATAAHATSSFAKTYLAQSKAVASLIRKAKAVSVSQVVATGLQSYSPAKGTATVLVALNDTTKNTKSPSGSVQYFRMQVQMVRQGDKWLASAVTPQ
jgi:Mce-associated membrane protein